MQDQSICVSADTPVAIPLRNAGGETVAVALVDAADARWLNRWRWYLTPKGYAARKPSKRPDGGRGSALMHRQILGLQWGQQVDHANRDRLDNRRANLRVATAAQNSQNLNPRPGKSRHRGVCWDLKTAKWRAYARVQGRLHTAGYFDDEEDAHRAVVALRRRLMPFSTEDAPALA